MSESNLAAVLTAVLAFHKPDAWKEPMVYSVWEDGEITIEKGGDLFGHRTIHCMLPGSDCTLPPDALPVKNQNGLHSRIFVSTNADALEVRDLIASSGLRGV